MTEILQNLLFLRIALADASLCKYAESVDVPSFAATEFQRQGLCSNCEEGVESNEGKSRKASLEATFHEAAVAAKVLKECLRELHQGKGRKERKEKAAALPLAAQRFGAEQNWMAPILMSHWKPQSATVESQAKPGVESNVEVVMRTPPSGSPQSSVSTKPSAGTASGSTVVAAGAHESTTATLSGEEAAKHPPAGLKRKKPVTVYVDGVFDLMHPGHFNALRQGALLGDELIVGVCSDEEVCIAKGVRPVYTCQERAEVVASCKWVSKVIMDVPYDVTLDFFKSTGCDFVAHGSDIATNQHGGWAYEEVERAGFLKVFKRTEGVSTTALAARLLAIVDTAGPPAVSSSGPQSARTFAQTLRARAGLSSSVNAFSSEGSLCESTRHSRDFTQPEEDTCPDTEHVVDDYYYEDEIDREAATDFRRLNQQCDALTSTVGTSTSQAASAVERGQRRQLFPQQAFQPSASQRAAIVQQPHHPLVLSKRLLQFIENSRVRGPEDVVVYVQGSFDPLHLGHIRFLQAAKKLGTYLLVGVYDDFTVRELKGPSFPVLSMLERAMNLMAMRVVDEVLIGAPLVISEFFLSEFKVDVVCTGTLADAYETEDINVTYKAPMEAGLFKQLPSDSRMTTNALIERIMSNRTKLMESLKGRKAKEEKFYAEASRGKVVEL